MNRTLCRFATLVLLLAAPAIALGQEPDPVPITASFSEAGAFNLTLAWRYRSGDDPRWADPAFDDRTWELVEPQMYPEGQLPHDGWQGIGWFRRHLRVSPELQGKPLVIRLESPGATEVFLDGEPLMKTPASAPALRAGGVWRVATFSRRADHVLAVRHTWSPQPVFGGNPGFRLSVETPDVEAIDKATEWRKASVVALITIVPGFLAAFLALFHGALYRAYPKARENLFYALTLTLCAGIGVLDFLPALTISEATRALVGRLYLIQILAAIFFGLLTYYAIRTRTFPRTWIGFAAATTTLACAVFLYPDDPPFSVIWSSYFGLMLAEVIRVEVSDRTIAREGARIVLVGFTIMGAVLVLQALVDFEVVPPFAGIGGVWIFGLLALEISMSLFLARNFARTSVRLASKTSEIEAARALQLSMLPGSLPAVPGLETAAVMVTASEVGGDYYDFRSEPDGSLVVAFGDATGHGVAAGTMVTAVKALFSTLGGGKSLTAVLAECDRVVREMQVKPLHMCLTLARVTPRSVTVCSAAMPPVLIHRAGSGRIEELGAGGRPIGSRLSGAWTEHPAPLASGDTLLFASDGFAEQLDSADHPLGYEALAETLGASANLSPRELLDRLLARVAVWRGNQEQGDDITFVAIRVQ